jgi:diguanylate cyclase (GGDEF)-like protein
MTATIMVPLAAGVLPGAGWMCTALLAVARGRRLRTDALTGIANREALTAAFAKALRRGGPVVGIVLLDLDGFKQVNDRHGHAVGNTVLCGVAQNLARVAGPGEVPVRLHGDEFAVLMSRLPAGPAGWHSARSRTQVFAAAVAVPVPVEDLGVVRVSATAGVAVAAVESAALPALLRVADQRMYAAKHPGPRTESESGVEGERGWTR